MRSCRVIPTTRSRTAAPYARPAVDAPLARDFDLVSGGLPRLPRESSLDTPRHVVHFRLITCLTRRFLPHINSCIYLISNIFHILWLTHAERRPAHIQLLCQTP